MYELENGEISISNNRKFCELNRAVMTINDAMANLESMTVEITDQRRLAIRLDQVVLGSI